MCITAPIVPSTASCVWWSTTGWVAIIHQNSIESTSESYLFVDDFTVITAAGCLYYETTDVANLRMTGLTKQSAYEVKVQALINEGGNWSEPLIFTTTDNKLTLADDDSELYFGADNQLYYPASDVTLNAFRAYFQLSDGTQGIKEFKLRFDDGTEESTGIISIENGKLIIENDSDAWYTLSGMRLEGKPVKKGVYIRGGRKVVVQ